MVLMQVRFIILVCSMDGWSRHRGSRVAVPGVTRGLRWLLLGNLECGGSGWAAAGTVITVPRMDYAVLWGAGC